MTTRPHPELAVAVVVAALTTTLVLLHTVDASQVSVSTAPPQAVSYNIQVATNQASTWSVSTHMARYLSMTTIAVAAAINH